MAIGALGAGLISAGVSTAGNLLGGLMSNGISYSQQRKLAEQQFQYQKELNQMAMDFNNPKNQMSLWREAGINPYAVVGNTTSINGGSVGQGSVSSPNFGNLGTSAVDAFNHGFTIQSEKQKIVADTQAALAGSELAKVQAKKGLEETAGLKMDNEIKQYMADDIKLSQKLQNQLTLEQIANQSANTMMLQLQAVGQDILNKNQQKMIDSQLSEQAARIELARKQGLLSDAQAQSAYQSALESAARRNGINIDNDILKRSADKIVNGHYADALYKHYDAQLKRMEVENFDTDKWFNRIGTALGGANNGSKAYRNVKPK